MNLEIASPERTVRDEKQAAVRLTYIASFFVSRFLKNPMLFNGDEFGSMPFAIMISAILGIFEMLSSNMTAIPNPIRILSSA